MKNFPFSLNTLTVNRMLLLFRRFILWKVSYCFVAIVSLSGFFQQQTFAQRFPCGTTLSEAQIAFELEKLSKKIEPYKALTVTRPVYIPVTIHIVRSSSGTGGFRTGQVDTVFEDLNRLYAQVELKLFQYGGIDYINNDTYFSIADSDEATRNDLRDLNSVDHTINIYFTNITSPGSTILCGESSFTLDLHQGIVINNSCAGIASDPSTVTHEVGHYFDLYHTHETALGTECPGGWNCSVAGDGLCDTPADPLLLNHVDANCIYDNYASTPWGCDTTIHYNPQTDNIMAYSNSVCMDYFTNDQINKLDNVLFTLRRTLFGNTFYVSSTATGTFGTPDAPYSQVSTAVTNANSGNYIFLKAGSYNETVTISKSLILKQWDESASNVIIGK